MNGILTNSTAIAAGDYNEIAGDEGVYLDSIGQVGLAGIGRTEDSGLKRFVWNMYNRVVRSLVVTDPTASWTYATNTFRQANASAANQVEIVTGLDEECINLTVMCSIRPVTTATNAQLTVGIGEDVTNVNNGNISAFVASNSTAVIVSAFCQLTKVPTVGYHFYAWLEVAINSVDTTIFGTPSAGRASGICGVMIG